MIKQHKLPTIVALLVLILGIVAGIYIIRQRQSLTSLANPEEAPKEVRITNITDKSFTVSWVTNTETTGFIAYGKSTSLGATTSPETKPALVHHVSIPALTPETTYHFKVASNNNLFENGSSPYNTKTAPALSSIPSPFVISGSVNISAGVPSPDILVYVTVPGTTPLSTTTDNSGRWSLPLSTARNASLSAYTAYTPTSILEIFAQAGKNRFATAKIQAGSARPVPPIILGKTHDFSDIKPLAGDGVPVSQFDIPTGSEVEEVQPTPTPIPSPTPAASQKTVIVTSPKQSEKINSTKPSFLGTGTPGLVFTIKVESEVPQTAQVTIDKNGKWTWTPPNQLTAGNHALTLTWKDNVGKTQTSNRNFTVLASGTSSDPAFTASGSAQVATPTPSPSPTPKATATPSATPKASPSPSPATSSGKAAVSTQSAVPVSGSLTATLSAIIMGIVLILLGLFLPRTRVFKYY